MTHKMSLCIEFPLLVAILLLPSLAGVCFGYCFCLCVPFLVCVVADGIATGLCIGPLPALLRLLNSIDSLASKLQFSLSAAIERL